MQKLCFDPNLKLEDSSSSLNDRPDAMWPLMLPATYTSAQYNYKYGHLDMTTDFSLSYILIYVTHNFFATLNQNESKVSHSCT